MCETKVLEEEVVRLDGSQEKSCCTEGRPSSAEHSLKPVVGRLGMAEGASVMEDGWLQNSVANGAWTRRQSVSLNLLLLEDTAGACPGWFPTSQSTFNTMPSSLPPFATFLQSHQEVVVDQNPDRDGAELSGHSLELEFHHWQLHMSCDGMTILRTHSHLPFPCSVT